MLVVAGKIDEAKTLVMINEYFGGIPRPTRVLQPTYSIKPIQDGERSVTLRRTGDTKVVSALYHIIPASHPDYLALNVLLDVLTDQPSGRLYKALIETKKASHQYGYSFMTKDPGYDYFAVEMLKEKSLDEAKAILLNMLDSIAIKALTKEEVDRSKAKGAKYVEMALKDVEQLGKSLNEYIATGDWRLVFLHRDILEKVTPADVKRVAAYYFKPSNRTVGMFIPDPSPDRVEAPDAPDLAALTKDYKGRAAIAQGEAFDASPANIDGLTKRVELPNTIEMALLPKSTRGSDVNATMTFRYGDAKRLMNKASASSFTAQMLNKGTTTRTRQQIKDEFDRLKAQVNVFGGGNSAMVMIKTNKENLPDVMKVVAAIMKNPVFDANEFDKLKQEQLVQIESQRSEPNAIASNLFGRTMSPYSKEDIRYTRTFDEQVAAVKEVGLEGLKKFHKDFYGAQNASVSVVGDFDEVQIRKLLSSDFGLWKAKMPFSRIISEYKSIPAGVQSIEAPDKANALLLAGINLPLRDDDPDYPALVLGNYMLGGGFLNSRLATRIRQKAGLCESGRVAASAPMEK